MERTKLVGARYERGWSQEEAAAAIGVTRSTLSQWERGISAPYPVHIHKLCEVYGRNAEELDLAISKDVIQPVTGGHDMHVLRRQLLQQAYQIAGLAMALPTGIEAESLSLQLSSPSLDREQLDQCSQMIQTSWQLLAADGLQTVGSLLPAFLPALDTLARQSSPLQKRAAYLATQGYILQGLVAVLQLNYSLAEAYCKQAVAHSQMAEDPNLEAAALKHLATKYQDMGSPKKVLQIYQQALSIKGMSGLLQSRTYLGLSVAYAQIAQKQEAFRYLELARETFPEDPESDPGYAYADCRAASLNHYGGLVHLEIGQAKDAWNIFNAVDSADTSIPDRTRVEIIDCQTEAAIMQRDLDLASLSIQEGIAGARRLKSEKRMNDAFLLYKKMRLVWPHEQRVTEVGDLFFND